MIETIVKTYLDRELLVQAVLEKPEPTPRRYVLIERVGGGGEDIKTATITIQSYAESLYQAATLNEQVKSAMKNLHNYDSSILLSLLNSDYNYTDTVKKHYRYQAVFDITYIGG